jgi:voltage-gated potassium channel
MASTNYGSLDSQTGSVTEPLLGGSGGGGGSGARGTGTMLSGSSNKQKLASASLNLVPALSRRSQRSLGGHGGGGGGVLKTVTSKRNVFGSTTYSSSSSPSNRHVMTPLEQVTEEGQQLSGSAAATATATTPWIGPKKKTHSFVYTMLNPRSDAWQATVFKWFITIVILLDLVGFIVSTEPNLATEQQDIFSTWEAVDSWIFLIEYILRVITVTESNKYGQMGPIKGRLRWMITTPALIDLAATFPYFVEKCTNFNLPTLTYLRAFRLLRILKTSGFSEATKSVCRVFYYNAEILYVAAMIGVGLVLFTAVLMYYLRPRDQVHPEFKSIPNTLYLSTLMLTGQGGPDGEIPWYTSSVVLLTGVFSIGMFAIPASMLTWGK